VNAYRNPLYARSLAEFGTPLHLPHSDGWLLRRPIPNSSEQDAVGCYPLFDCGDWKLLDADISRLESQAISVALVVNPFAAVDAVRLHELFPDMCRVFKEHAIVDFERSWRESISRHHRRNVRTAARHVDVERCAEPLAWLETWTELYSRLIDRHDVFGIARFSPASFERQLRVPGIAAFRASIASETVGMLLWYAAGPVAYYHLGAFSPRGYASRAAFALFDVALNYWAEQGMHWALLGGGAGWQAVAEDGLARFKNGWANDRRSAWFCGRILAPEKYARLAAARRPLTSDYFPKYRHPEAA
jgi:Acetyltransferase (GNAT) domain